MKKVGGTWERRRRDDESGGEEEQPDSGDASEEGTAPSVETKPLRRSKSANETAIQQSAKPFSFPSVAEV